MDLEPLTPKNTVREVMDLLAFEDQGIIKSDMKLPKGYDGKGWYWGVGNNPDKSY